MIPSLFPHFDATSKKLLDGSFIGACSFCKKAIQNKSDCRNHYNRLLTQPPGYFQCPFGFTSRTFYFDGQMQIITGVIAFPRFDSNSERERAKQHPEVKVSRDDIERVLGFFRDIEQARANTIQEAAKVFPQAFHELRKLNGAVLQTAEREIRNNGEIGFLQTIRSAAELMRNNFDILEALSNIDSMRAVPLDATINVYDLVYKMRCVYLERAVAKKMQISVLGVRAIIRGSQKSFPIVPAVLIENAIKYGRPSSTIRANIQGSGKVMVLTVDNETDYMIDEVECFNRGSRFASDKVEGGGFGLFLAREIVLAHEGKIRCEQVGPTIRMTVELPMEKVVPL